MNRVLHINFVGVIILQHVVSKIVWKLETQDILFKRNEVHIDLRYFFLLEHLVLVEKLVTFNGSSWHEEDVNILFISFLPIFALCNNLLYDINIWPSDENNGLILNIRDVFIDVFVIKCNFLFHLARVWEISNYKWEDLKQRFLNVNCFISWTLFKEFGKLFVVMGFQESEIDLILCLYSLSSSWLWAWWYLLWLHLF